MTQQAQGVGASACTPRPIQRQANRAQVLLRPFERLASLELTLFGLAALAAGVLAYASGGLGATWALVSPLALLAVNLASAVATNPIFRRQNALLTFHLALIAIVLLVAAGRLTYLRGQLELSTGETFAGQLTRSERGPLHLGRIAEVSFTNNGFTISYSPGLKRDRTRNEVSWIAADGGARRAEIGDQEPLVLNGYSFYTSPNKGFAPLFTWKPAGALPVRGTIHLPAYPMHEFGQALEWSPPGTDAKLWVMLQIDEALIDPEKSWQFRPPKTYTLVLRSGDQRVELRPGDAFPLATGTLVYEGLTSWMGYSVDYDWTLPWLLAACLLAVASLAWHFWCKFSARPWNV